MPDDAPLPPLPPRPATAHKASTGRVLIVGGSLGMSGAPTLAARGALRAGAGLVTIAVPERIQDVVASLLPEALTIGLPCDDDGCLMSAAAEVVKARLDRIDAIVVGPGLGRTPGTEQAILRIVAAAGKPLVLDADGLYAFRMRLADLAARTAPTVLTPHKGEASGLLGETEDTAIIHRESRATRIARGAKCVCVLKGPGTIVTDGVRVRRNTTGGPVLASGGTGDVLAGAIAAFLAGLPATGGDAFGAACLAAHVHGAAGDRLASARGDRGILASEVADALLEAIRDLVSGSAPR